MNYQAKFQARQNYSVQKKEKETNNNNNLQATRRSLSKPTTKISKSDEREAMKPEDKLLAILPKRENSNH